MSLQKYLLIPIILSCLGALNTASAQCMPNCSMNDSCIVVVKPAAGDTIIENDMLPIEFVVGIDLVTAWISSDSGKSWKGLLTNAITVKSCTTRISSIQAPLLERLGAQEDTKIKPCKIRIVAYGATQPSGISNGYFYIKRQNSSVRFNNRKSKSGLSKNTGNKLYNFFGQSVDSKTAHRSGIFLSVNKTYKVVILNKTFR